MGDVYRGYDESLDRHVAIKVLPPELARDEDFVRRFHSEATAAGKLDHPNVVRVYFTGEENGHHFFAMQFIEGQSLGERLARRSRMSLEESLETVEQCLAGLEAAHAHGLVHRDIKPGNVLLDPQTGRTVLADFGLVHRIGSGERMTATGMVMGTLDYIAPEQARGQEVDGRADIYSLGVLWYRLLAGRLPFQAETPTAMLFQHAYEKPFPLAHAAPAVPHPVIEIIGRMMAKSVEDRYASCAEVLADIQAFREDRPLAAVEGGSGTQTTTILPAPDPLWEPELAAGLEESADNRRWSRARDWAATVFRRHAPEFVQNLQGTTQQVDGAVAHYERHCERLARLHEEAQSIAAELEEQVQANIVAAAAAMQEFESATGDEEEQAALTKKRESEENIQSLKKQHDEQRQQIDQIENQLSRADARLAQLRSHRDVLQARLGAAEARQRWEGGRPRPKRLRWVVAGLAVASLFALGVAVGLLLSNPQHARKPDLAVSPFDTQQARKHQEEWAEYLGVPVEFTNSFGMKFRLIPPGEFLMGSTPEERELVLEDAKARQDQRDISSIPSEGPQHKVRIG